MPLPAGLHECQVRVVRPDNGERDHLKLAIGEGFGPPDRWRGEPLDIGGRTAYRTFALRSVNEGERCRLDFPLSATRSVRVSLDTTAPDPALGRALGQDVAPEPYSSADRCVHGDTWLLFDVRESPLEDPGYRDAPTVALSFGAGILDD
ncbi:MAG: hypothetical protein ACRDTC_22375 [Pseudonocardiaceae bacterium]